MEVFALMERQASVKINVSILRPRSTACRFESGCPQNGKTTLTAALSALAWMSSTAKELEHYQQVNLVSDQPGVALLQDTNLFCEDALC